MATPSGYEGLHIFFYLFMFFEATLTLLFVILVDVIGIHSTDITVALFKCPCDYIAH